MPYLPFILGVDIGCLVGFHQVVRANHAAVGDEFPCFPLRFAQIGAVAAAIGEGGDLDVIERDIALLPERTPQPYHVGKADGIVLILVYVRFTLIPQEATDGIPRHRVQHGIVHHHRAQPVGRSLDAFFRQVDIGIGFQYLAVRPTLDTRPAPRAVDNADRHVQHVAEQFGKEITRGGEIGRGLHRTWPPFPRNPILGRIGRREGYFHVAEPVAHTPRTGYDLVGPGDGTVIEPAERHLHIALPAGEPDFADQYVVEHDPIAAYDRHLLRLITAGRGVHPRRPTAVGIASHGAFGTPRGFDPHRGPGIGPAPEAALGILLEHHVAADDLGQFDLGRGTPCGGKANKGQNEFLHIGAVSIYFPQIYIFSGNREYPACIKTTRLLI